ncbi:putative lipid kinase BmrU [bioreactor metagenome]|uniref:Putative lipid kinase BmrU n=1 Tax=bioreactor metagenome TaxID=1076179 RepID=A0A645HJZ9_9ZZZZ
MTLDHEVVKKKALLIAVMNGKYYGGGFLPTPMSEIQDGLLDICVVEDMPLLRIFKMLPKYFKGQHTDLPEVRFYQSERVTLKTAEPVLYGCDGETHHATAIEYQLQRKALALRVPQGSTLL